MDLNNNNHNINKANYTANDINLNLIIQKSEKEFDDLYSRMEKMRNLLKNTQNNITENVNTNNSNKKKLN